MHVIQVRTDELNINIVRELTYCVNSLLNSLRCICIVLVVHEDRYRNYVTFIVFSP